MEARQSHELEVLGSNPSPAITVKLKRVRSNRPTWYVRKVRLVSYFLTVKAFAFKVVLKNVFRQVFNLIDFLKNLYYNNKGK